MLKNGYQRIIKNMRDVKNQSMLKELPKEVKGEPVKKIEFHNPYHHNFQLNYDEFSRDKTKMFFTAFDLFRVFGAAFVIIKIGMKLPSFILFRRSKFENNPDFMLVDQSQFEMLDK